MGSGETVLVLGCWLPDARLLFLALIWAVGRQSLEATALSMLLMELDSARSGKGLKVTGNSFQQKEDLRNLFVLLGEEGKYWA